MSENPYARPTAFVADVEHAPPSSQHRRPLWVGLLLGALAPVLLPVGLLLVGTLFERDLLFVALAVGTAGLIVSGGATVCLALPLVLLLRRIGRLTGYWVCAGTVFIGAFAMGFATVGLTSGASAALRGSLTGLVLGAVFGLVAGVALVWGAGIRFRSVRGPATAREGG